jgi:hypothetical protein
MRFSIIILFSIIIGHGFAQLPNTITPDSLGKIASRNSYTQWIKDSLTIQAWADNMRVGIQNKFNADSLQLKNKIDSLTSINLPTSPYTAKLDILVELKKNLVGEVEAKQQELLTKTEQKLSAWKQTVTGRLDSLGTNTKIPGVDLPNVESISLPELDLPEMPSLSVNDFVEMEISPDLFKINNDLPFGSIDGLEGIQESFSNISENISNIGDIKANPDLAIDQVANKIEGVSEIRKIGEMENPMEQLPSGNPDKVIEQAKKQAVNHFAGKEEQLNKAMDQISKYKQKYSSVQSIKDLPKKVLNEMKDKPFVERLVPGISFQYQFRNSYLLDIYSYAGYRLTGRVTTGIGWNQRLARDPDNNYWNHKAAIYGPRAFGDYRLGKGFNAHLESETMNTFVPYSRIDPDTGQREWVWSIMTGIKKEYRITKNLMGTVLVLYNLFDPRHRSPYNDRLNTRIGFEYMIKKKSKKKDHQ